MAFRRRSVSRRRSKKIFRKTAGHRGANNRNFARPIMRGGIRL